MTRLLFDFFYLSKQFPNILILIPSFTSSSKQQDVHFVNYGLVLSEWKDKAGYALGRGYPHHWQLIVHDCLSRIQKGYPPQLCTVSICNDNL